MGRRDVGDVNATKNLASARKKRDQAASMLSGTPKNADRGRDDALRAGQHIRDAVRDADSAIREAEEYNGRAQDQKSRNLLQEARDFRASLDTPLVVTETLQRPQDKNQQQELQKRLKGRVKDAAADQVANELLTRLAQYATAHTVDGLISVLSNLPPGTGKALPWAGGAVSEGMTYVRGKWRTARTGVNPETGQCTSRRMCHNCRYNSENPGHYRPCMNT